MDFALLTFIGALIVGIILALVLGLRYISSGVQIGNGDKHLSNILPEVKRGISLADKW